MEAKVFTIRDKCCTCGTCAGICPEKAILMREGYALTDPGKCKGCGTCVPRCPAHAKRFEFPMPEEAAIRDALRSLGRSSPRDQYDCGACGFGSCREKAIAICRGLSSPEGCLFKPTWVAPSSDSDPSLVAYSVEMGRVVALAEKMSRVTSTVLITGESGTGKEVIARFIHRSSQRREGPFIKINCGAIPESLLESELFGYETGAFTGARKEGKPGLIELASDGTLFLDEISELPLNLQVKLLQVIQEKQITRIGGTRPVSVDIRIIAATNKDLEGMVRQASFRADLYYRLNVVPIRIPPLRDRKDDIIPLTYHFLERFSKKYGRRKVISQEAKEALMKYDWPGNVRELENLIERLVVTVEDGVIRAQHIPHRTLHEAPETPDQEPAKGTSPAKVVVHGIIPLREACEEVERQLLFRTFEKYRNTYATARILGVNQSTVVRKLHKYMEDNRAVRVSSGD